MESKILRQKQNHGGTESWRAMSGECWSGEWEGERSFDRMLKINRIEDGDGACIKDKSKASANGAISVFTRIIFF